ncbi:hypothetical protein [Naasia aerilata]|uniref:Uncharacterized protein n=1 Tax=Naasia aerilata TaxID=1162966 RepID=A0ABN6XLU8_9MICO|nr:hypothetical protein [Naasia aerilata]BDZ45955.1 hypothetical protein GCM10025866_18640 [Naasia aerilata]
MSDSVPAVLGFGVIFLLVGALGGYQLGLLASIIFLAAGALLLAGGGTWLLVGLRRRAALTRAAISRPSPVAPTAGQ